jgi:eukaryotic-like serine/threonine-protein kinase
MEPSALNEVLSERYVVEREIGRGGMATVFLARDLRHSRLVALKVLNPELGAVLGVERFLSEIRVTANLQHPNLLPLFDSGAADGTLYYVMPYVEGESLRARLDREKQLPIDEAMRYALAIANALDYAHSHGVVHRDLKPENILLQHGEAVIADFGIALAVSNAGGSRITQTGLSLGTPQYMSPEQATGDRTIDGRSDVYSLAAMTYEMLGGEPPHTGSSGQAIIAKLMTEEPRRVTALRRTVPAHVEAAVHRGLEKLPADRWSTVREFAEALKGVRPASMAPAVAARRGPLWIVGGVAVGALLLAGVEAWRLRSTPDSTDPVILRFSFVTPDSETFLPTTPAIPFSVSADSRRVAYIGSGPNAARIYVRGLDDMQTRALANTEHPLSPAFSPDGKWVAAIIGTRIVKTPVDGGPLTTVLALGPTVQVAGMDWFKPDTIVAAVGGVLQAVPVDGGSPVVLSIPDSAHGERLQWGPRVIDDRFIAYISVGGAGIATNKIGMLDRKSGRAMISPFFGTTILGSVDDHLIWVQTNGNVMAAAIDRDGKLGPAKLVLENVLVRPGGAAKATMSRGGTLIYQRGMPVAQLMVVDERGIGTPLGVEARAYAHPRWSPDGSRIAVAVGRVGGSDVWMIDTRTKATTKLTNGDDDDQPSWTADGKHILYRSIDATGTRLKLIASDGSEAAGRPLNTMVNPYSGLLSHDGQWLIYRTGDAGRYFRDILAVRTSGDTATRELVTSPASDIDPQVSPDDRWLAYSSDISGRPEVYARAFDGSGRALQVSSSGGAEAAWSSDGHTLYYRAGRLMTAATISGSPPAVAATRTIFDGPSFIGDIGLRNYDVSADGKHFLMLQGVDRQAETIVIYNWAAELRKSWR